MFANGTFVGLSHLLLARADDNVSRRPAAEQPYPVQAAAFWAIEHVYNQAWQAPGAMPEPYAEFASRWGNGEFTAYVEQLQQQADNALRGAAPEEVQRAEEAVADVARLEVGFWNMAYAGDS
jgi:formylaminopyrimidine deformylase / aminopyrimidine aminohydrolase